MTPERKSELRDVAREWAFSSAYGFIATPMRELFDALDAAHGEVIHWTGRVEATTWENLRLTRERDAAQARAEALAARVAEMREGIKFHSQALRIVRDRQGGHIGKKDLEQGLAHCDKLLAQPPGALEAKVAAALALAEAVTKGVTSASFVEQTRLVDELGDAYTKAAKEADNGR